MKIEIIKSELPSYWYNKRIGDVLDVTKTNLGYIPTEKGYSSFVIAFDDAKRISLITYLFKKNNMSGIQFWALITGTTFVLIPVFGIVLFWTKNDISYKLFVTNTLIFVVAVVFYNIYKSK